MEPPFLGHRGVGSDEDGTAVPDLAEDVQRVADLDGQVLGGDAVHDLDGEVHVLGDDVAGVVHGLLDDLPPGSLLDHPLHDLPGLVREVRVACHQQAGGRGVVLGLGDEVRGEELRDGGIVGEDAYLGGAGGEVDLHLVPQHHLGTGDEDVAGADDLLDGLDALGTEGHRGDGLRPAGLVDLVDARDIGSDEGERIDGCGRAHDDLVDSGYACGDDGHEHGAGI